MSIRRPSNNSKFYEKQKNEEQFDKVPEEVSNKDNWSKNKKKKKSKNCTQELYKNKTNKVNEINQQPTNLTQNKFNHKVDHNGLKEQNNMKIPENKNRAIADNLKNDGICMRKNRKYQNSIEVPKSNITQRGFIRQPEKQHSHCRNSDRNKNYLNNRQTKNEKNNEQFEQNSTIDKYSNDCDGKNELSSSTMFKPTAAITHREHFPNTNLMKYNGGKRIVDNRETKCYKNNKCSQREQDVIDNHTKQIWDLYCQNGQNNNSMNRNILNKTENSRKNKNNVNNVEHTARATTENSKSKTIEDQTFNANNINSNRPNQLSNLTYFINNNQKRVQENQLNVSTSYSEVKIPIHNTQKHFQSEPSEEKNRSYNNDDITDGNYSKFKKNIMEITGENLNCNLEINSPENHEELNKYTNIKREENNIFPDDNFIAYTFRVWEEVIQEISGY